MHCFLQRVRGTLIKDHKSDDMTHQEPLSGALSGGIHMDESKWMQVPFSGACALVNKFSNPLTALSLFPSISIQRFPSALSTH